MSRSFLAAPAPGKDGPVSTEPRRLVRRLAQLVVGVFVYGFSLSLLVWADLGLDPWDVLHQGLAERLGLSIGTVLVIASVIVLALWIPLKQRPGVGTVVNAVGVGVAMDLSLAVLPSGPVPLGWRIAAMLAGVALNGIATAVYIGARLGPGPRDGLMTGLNRVTGRSIRLVRTVVELIVLAAGFLLGGTVGIGTVVYALGIGPIAQLFMPLLRVPGGGADQTPNNLARSAADEPN